MSHQYNAPSTQPWSFPNLKKDEIITSLSELGVHGVTDDLLQNPDKYKDQVKRMLEQLTEICVGMSRDEMSQPAFAGLGTLSYPELHEDSVPQLNSFRACSKMMDIVCAQKFGLKDLVAPSSKKLCRQLSGIINFAKFREDRLALLNDLENTKKASLDKRQMLQDKHDVLVKRLASLREQAAEESVIINRIEKDCGDIENKISGLNVNQAHIREEISQLKSYNNNLKDEIASKSLELEEQSMTKKRLTSQIVSSPEKVRKQIIDTGNLLKMEQTDAKAADKKIRDLSGWIANVEDAQSEVTLALEAISELRAEVEREKSITSEIDNVNQSIHSKRQAFQELDQNIQLLGRQVHRADEKLQSIRKQASSRSAETQLAVEQVHRQLVEAESVRHHSKSNADRAEVDVSRLHQELDFERDTMEKVRECLLISDFVYSFMMVMAVVSVGEERYGGDLQASRRRDRRSSSLAAWSA
jgi:kinetochore protein Nuf2